jgi:hypothetical protein
MRVASFDDHALGLLRGNRGCVMSDDVVYALMGTYHPSARRDQRNERFEPLPSPLP